MIGDIRRGKRSEKQPVLPIHDISTKCYIIPNHRNIMSILTRSIPRLFNPTNLQHLRKMTSTPAAHIKSLDHLVLTVASIPRTTEWYQTNLGMKSEQFVSSATPDITRHSLLFGSQKINLHELGKVPFSYPPHFMSSK